jgi:molybdate transport system substrate-binding protein
MNNTALAGLLAVSLWTAGAAGPAMADTIAIYAAAAVKTPLTAIAGEYERRTGHRVTIVYDTAGATEQKFRADPQAALLITTMPLIRSAERSGALSGGMSMVLGGTYAGVAVPPNAAKPDVSSPEKLKAALLAARRIAVSDPARGATVGTHFMKVVEALGIKDQILPKISFARDGVETMHMLLENRADIGVSQSSEILQASHDSMAGPFPKEFALATEFSLWHRNALSPAVGGFVAALTGPEGRAKLAAEGLSPPAR